MAYAIYGISRVSSRRLGSQPVKPALEGLSVKRKSLRLPSNQVLLRRESSVQAKLRLTQVGDPFEREADAVAERFVAHQSALGNDVFPAPVQVSRLCDECAEEETVPVEEEEQDVEDDTEPDESGMPKRIAGSNVTSVPQSIVPRGGGRGLAPSVRESMEAGFGADFGAVRIHTDSAASRSASHMGALAYTVGNNIYFGAGQYSPSTQAGTKLLAHEMTHVVQQQGRSGTLSAKPAPGPPAKKKKSKPAPNACAGSCPWKKQKKVVHNDCSPSEPLNQKKYITALAVDMGAQQVVATWSTGTTDTFPCSPNPKSTPKGNDVVGVKCSINHTNMKKDGMAWFTGFQSEGMRIGFHDSQTVAKGVHSHGCVRVCCSVAELINKNTWSGKTTIQVK
jgi:hypothetical protein